MTGPDAKCLGCGSPLPEPFLDLGKMPLANSFVRPEHLHLPEETFYLAVAFCQHCYLVQLVDIVPPEKLFTEYLYFSSYSTSFLSHAREMADTLIQRFELGSSSRVLEIASNDGYLLQFFKNRHIPVLGVEPAKNVAAEAQRRGIPTVNQFFDLSVVPKIESELGRATLILGINVLAHVPEVNGFLRAVRTCLQPSGVAVFEFPYVKELLERVEFDTIYHEHVFYFSLSAIRILAERAGLELFDVSRHPLHGGSLRVFLQSVGTRPVGSAVRAMLAEEERAGLTGPEYYASFIQSVAALRMELSRVVRDLKDSGKRLVAYGAPAKGNTLLNYCGIGRDLIEFTADRNIHKQGLYLPGTRIPIEAPEKISQMRPDYLIILPWNLKDEIMEQMSFIREWGGKFVIPLPRVQVCA